MDWFKNSSSLSLSLSPKRSRFLTAPSLRAEIKRWGTTRPLCCDRALTTNFKQFVWIRESALEIPRSHTRSGKKGVYKRETYKQPFKCFLTRKKPTSLQIVQRGVWIPHRNSKLWWKKDFWFDFYWILWFFDSDGATRANHCRTSLVSF